MVAEREEVQLTEKREDPQNKTQGNRNEVEIVFDAISCNESFARVADKGKSHAGTLQFRFRGKQRFHGFLKILDPLSLISDLDG